MDKRRERSIIILFSAAFTMAFAFKSVDNKNIEKTYWQEFSNPKDGWGSGPNAPLRQLPVQDPQEWH